MLCKHFFSFFSIIWFIIFMISFINFNNDIMIFKPNIWFSVGKFFDFILLNLIILYFSFLLLKLSFIFSSLSFSFKIVINSSWLISLSINAYDTEVSMLLSLLLANIRVLSCFFFLFLIMFSSFLTIPVVREKIK